MNEIEEEMDMWTKEFKKYLVVKKVESSAQAIEMIHSCNNDLKKI